MPLAQQINKRAKAGDFTIVCTARIMTFADFEFLMNEGINPNMILSRKDGDMRPDGEMKLAKLKSLFNLKQFRDKNKIMFDDAASVRSTLRGLLDAVIDPLKINGRI